MNLAVYIEVDTGNDEHNQHNGGDDQEREDYIEKLEQDQHTAGDEQEKERYLETQRDEEHGDTQIMGGT
eukprot:15332761-Heterocapsa_arctica.AAC.1